MHQLVQKIKNKTILIIFTTILIILIILEIITYNSFINSFYSTFNNNDFSIAYQMVNTKENKNPMIRSIIKKDTTNFFSCKLDKLYLELQKGETSTIAAQSIIEEIKKYDFVAPVVQSKADYLSSYVIALSSFNNESYKESFDQFKSLSDSPFDESLSLKKSSEIIIECQKKIKEQTYKKVEEFRNINYYSDALDLLDQNFKYFENDEEYVDTIDSVMVQRQSYLAAKSNSKDTKMDISTITSSTPYLITVDLSKQKTTIYSGKKNDWSVLNSFICSTGKKDQSTPIGSFVIMQKGEWFYSSKYKEGAKYWVQFQGNYLFHSLPYNYDQTTVVDKTLGTPASHGCIRLSEDNAKWLYQNIPSGTKLVIK